MIEKTPLVKIGSLCKINSGGTPRRGIEGYYGGKIPWAKIGDIENAENGYLYNTIESITPDGLKSINNRIFKKDTILLALYGSVGKTAIVGKEMSTNQAILGLSPKKPDVLYFKYLKYWLDYSKPHLVRMARGVALQNISATIVKDYFIPLPPIEEQHRIAKTLDLAQSLIEKRKQAIAYLDDYIKAVFLHMFGDPVSNPKGWDKKTMSELTIKIGSGATPKGGKSSYVRDGISLIRSLNIHDNLFIDKNLAFINERQAKALSNVQVEENDVLLNITGASVGRCAVVPNRILPARVNQHVSILRTNEKLNPYFLLHLLISDSFKRKLLKDANAGGATREALTKQHIEDLEIICPPIEEQNRFCNIEKLDDILKQKMQSQLEELENNFQAEMQRAFQSD